jgi:HTH-type transcriptional regulator/antitoxin HigA
VAIKLKFMDFKIKVIKTDEDYKEALELVSKLVEKDPAPDSEDGEKLDILVALIKEYESKTFPESMPDPIDAIWFRMEQQNLKPKDLVAYIGNKSKVSEVLSRKRPLTLAMIRALEAGLGIPAKVLVKEADSLRDVENIIWDRFPLREMEKRGYFGSKKLSKLSDIKLIMEKFFQPVGSPANLLGLLRKTNYRSVRPVDKHALVVWATAVARKSNENKYPVEYKKGKIDLAFMQELAKISAKENSPVLAQKFLKSFGIGLVVEPCFSQTYLDGATSMIDKKHPVIGLTLRHDRLDNFWFTLMHELSHISLHYDKNINLFYDDLDSGDSVGIEGEADELAGEALVPKIKWENSPAKLIPSPIAAESLANELGVHVSIVAGKMRHEGDKYQYLNTIINQAKVRMYFPDVKWVK